MNNLFTLDPAFQRLEKRFPGFELCFSLIDSRGCVVRIKVPGNDQFFEGKMKPKKNRNQTDRLVSLTKRLLRANYKGKQVSS
jgi:hypothetical protein